MNLIYVIFVILMLGPLLKLFYLWINYQGRDYQKQTGVGFFKMRRNAGLRGEYTIYQRLKNLEDKPRFLFNLYLPKEDESFSEMDVLMLHSSGLYAFESKNYKGWIFGSEKGRYWTQVLPAGKGKSRKHSFYNPIKQHQTHIKWLNYFLSEDMPICHSYIVFGDQASFKKLDIQNSNHQVLHYWQLKREIKKQVQQTGEILTELQIQIIYNRLYPLTQVNQQLKTQHLQRIIREFPDL